MPDCVFCRIVAGELPADVVRRSERSIAIRDINPVAPLHVLVIPVDHHTNLAEAAAADPQLVSALAAECEQVAQEAGETDYRVVTNSGPLAGQSVYHLHLHVLGGRQMGWPPG